jgi:hypothetical protein
MHEFRSGPRVESFVGAPNRPATLPTPTRVLPSSAPRTASARSLAGRAALLADTMSDYLGTANRPETGSSHAERVAQGERVRVEFNDVFVAPLTKVCRELKRHHALSDEEGRLIQLTLAGTNFGLHSIACFLADRARQLGPPPRQPGPHARLEPPGAVVSR